MTKIIWLSDLHYTARGTVSGYDPRIRLQAAIDFINTHHDDADICVLSGDLVNHGTAMDYAALSDQLKSLRPTMAPMVGNHDNRSLLRAHFDVPSTAMPDFVQYALVSKTHQILCLDTQKHGADAGQFCAERLRWLHTQLRKHPSLPSYLFMHHPPMPLGLPMQDQDRMENGDAFLDALSDHANVKHLFIGHVHRPITGTVRGIPFATMRSVLYQAPAPKPDWTWQTFAPAPEAPQLGVLTLDGADSQLHFTQFCDHNLGS